VCKLTFTKDKCAPPAAWPCRLCGGGHSRATLLRFRDAPCSARLLAFRVSLWASFGDESGGGDLYYPELLPGAFITRWLSAFKQTAQETWPVRPSPAHPSIHALSLRFSC
jgi:hypothetical protein